ncbi:MAG: sulfur carrier protein ThiS [marine benthic group bacterium]|nr:sulfur carrier protein ThiS [Gemmatimonadota bacterium]MCL7963215.1 sulfur carrier protein ThiS [Candidatus Carthagonibacter metallireducens]MCL7969490.1 sulfur carrier protein ThiS [Gemmatimonadota bacterium]MCL7973350.1 sulfur carrier protein ThiS [Gemmatimonadota bacterium]MCL7980917.1 sulfur carrier protein ThiS [Gemmatimonadota bacterium]
MIRPRSVPGLHVICPDDQLEREDALLTMSALCTAGGAGLALHLRPRRVSARRCWELARALSPISSRTGGWIVINGRTDVAKLIDVDAVQLGHGALPIDAARELLGGDCAIGVSVHSEAEAFRADQAGADFLLLGTIFPTASHPDEPGAGVSRIHGCFGLEAPVIAIGGIDESRVSTVIEAGASGVAVIRAVWGAHDPADAVRRLIAELETSRLRSGIRMRIEVNGKPVELESSGTVQDLLHELGLDSRMVVVERNREIVRRDDLEAVRVAEGDSYEIVQFVGGG